MLPLLFWLLHHLWLKVTPSDHSPFTVRLRPPYSYSLGAEERGGGRVGSELDVTHSVIELRDMSGLQDFEFCPESKSGRFFFWGIEEEDAALFYLQQLEYTRTQYNILLWRPFFFMFVGVFVFPLIPEHFYFLDLKKKTKTKTRFRLLPLFSAPTCVCLRVCASL